MAMPLQEVLERRFGVDEVEFADALREFADRSGPIALVDIVPGDYLGARQLEALRRVGASVGPLQPPELGPVAALAATHAQLLKESLGVATVAKRLNVDASRVRQRIYARSLYAIKHRGAWLVPAFQLDGRRLLPGLDVVLGGLAASLHPVAVSRWFTAPNTELLLDGEPVSPVVWLSSGGPPETAAQLVGDLDQL